VFAYVSSLLKGTVQRDRSGRNKAHSIDVSERKRRGGFLEKYARPPSSESPLKYESTSYFSTANYAISLDSCGEYTLRTWSTLGPLKKEEIEAFF
jgi:hypothetical protein